MSQKKGSSLIIPTVYPLQIVKRAIDSALIQKPPLDEIIVVDDKKADRPDLQRYCQEHGCRYLKSGFESKGGSIARNIGLFFANYLYILYMDDDDYFYSDDSAAQLIHTLKEHHVELTWGDILFHTYYSYKGKLNFRRIVGEEEYKKGELYTTIHNCVIPSMVAHINDINKFIWPPGRVSDVLFIRNCRKNKVTYKRTPHITAVYGKKSVSGEY